MNQDIIGRALTEVMPQVQSSGLFASLCTIQDLAGMFSDSGQPLNSYVAVAGLIDIPCMVTPNSQNSITATQKRTQKERKEDNSSHVLLNDYYPQITAHWQAGAQAVVDGVAYTLLGVESDSQGRMTRMKVELCTI